MWLVIAVLVAAVFAPFCLTTAIPHGIGYEPSNQPAPGIGSAENCVLNVRRVSDSYGAETDCPPVITFSITATSVSVSFVLQIPAVASFSTYAVPPYGIIPTISSASQGHDTTSCTYSNLGSPILGGYDSTSSASHIVSSPTLAYGIPPSSSNPTAPVYSSQVPSPSSAPAEYSLPVYGIPTYSNQGPSPSSIPAEHSSLPTYGTPTYSIPVPLTSGASAEYPSVAVYSVPAPTENPPISANSVQPLPASSALAEYSPTPEYNVPALQTSFVLVEYEQTSSTTPPLAFSGYSPLPLPGSNQLYPTTDTASVPPTITLGPLESSSAAPIYPNVSPVDYAPVPPVYQPSEEYQPSPIVSGTPPLVYISIPVYPIPSSGAGPICYISAIPVDGSTSLLVATGCSTYDLPNSVQGPGSIKVYTQAPFPTPFSLPEYDSESFGNAYGEYSGLPLKYSEPEGIATPPSSSGTYSTPSAVSSDPDAYGNAEAPTKSSPGQNLTVPTRLSPVVGYTGSALKSVIRGTTTAFICLLVAMYLS